MSHPGSNFGILATLMDIGQFVPDDLKDAVLKEEFPCQRLVILSGLLLRAIREGKVPDECLVAAIYVTSRDYLNEVFERDGVTLRLGGETMLDEPTNQAVN